MGRVTPPNSKTSPWTARGCCVAGTVESGGSLKGSVREGSFVVLQRRPAIKHDKQFRVQGFGFRVYPKP